MSDLAKYKERIFREMYYYELGRKDKIQSWVFAPTTIVIVLTGVLAYYFREFGISYGDVWQIAFFIARIIMSLSILWTLSFLGLILLYYKYRYIETSYEISERFADIEEMGNVQGYNDIEMIVEDENRRLLIIDYMESETSNRVLNDRRIFFLYLAYVGIIVSVISFIISIFLYIVLYFR